MTQGELLDDFDDVSTWNAVASGEAHLELGRGEGRHGSALRLDFDFKGGGGFVVASKAFSLRVPETFAISFYLRGVAPANRFELKLSDPSGRNVWWYHVDAMQFPVEWQPIRIRSREIEFAWGPAGGGSLQEVGRIELVIAAGPGGRGTVWIDDLRIEDLTVRATPRLTASSWQPGFDPTHVLDEASDTCWRSVNSRHPQWLQIDFQQPRELGGLEIHWLPGDPGRAFDVEVSDDAATWTTKASSHGSEGERSYLYLPSTETRYLRLSFRSRDSDVPFGIARIYVKPFDFSRSIHGFFENLARAAPRGWYPRYLLGEQTYWSPVGAGDGGAQGLLNEEGMLEVDRGAFSLEPFLLVEGRLITWAQVTCTQQLAEESLPIPSVRWQVEDVTLTISAFVSTVAGREVLFASYRVESAVRRPIQLFVAVRPFQVTPPWQAFRELGGVTSIRQLRAAEDAIWVNESKAVFALTPSDAFGASAFEQGVVSEHLAGGQLPSRQSVVDDFGYASGAIRFDLDAAPAEVKQVYLAVPLGSSDTAQVRALRAELSRTSGDERFERAQERWRNRLAGLDIAAPPVAGDWVATARTAAAHILINRDGVALQPGPRRYTRSWIRDGAIMSAALLRLGCIEEAQGFVRWYAGFQAADGNVPCCVDRSGPDWLVEHDSHGQLVFAIMECFRFSRDRAFLQELWPSALRAARYIEQLRRTRMTPEYSAGPNRGRYGLLPESASHEGYLAHPVHSYWDDFWAVRGLSDAAEMAALLGDGANAAHLAEVRDGLRDDLYASVQHTIDARRLSYVPGSVEWADFDPTATSVALSITDGVRGLPAGALRNTYQQYLDGFRKRRDGLTDWNNYTAYEVRIIGALVRVGERQAAAELTEFFVGDRRPLAWNQWPEISWRDPRSPGHLGDLPHSWIGAEYVLSLLSLFAYEERTDDSLVLAAGVPAAWLSGTGEVGVRELRTYYGSLTYRLRRESETSFHLSLAGLHTVPPGGIRIALPLPSPIRSVEINGRRWGETEPVVCRECPAEIRCECD